MLQFNEISSDDSWRIGGSSSSEWSLVLDYEDAYSMKGMTIKSGSNGGACPEANPDPILDPILDSDPILDPEPNPDLDRDPYPKPNLT